MSFFDRGQNIGTMLKTQLLSLLSCQTKRFSRLLHVDSCRVPLCHILVSHEMLIDIHMSLCLLLFALTTIFLLFRDYRGDRNNALRSPCNRSCALRSP